MTSYLDLRITSPEARTIFISGDKYGSMRRLINFLEGLQNGVTYSAVGTTILAESAAARATGTITFANTAVTGNATVINGVSFSGTQLAARVRATLVTPVATNVVTLAGVAFTAAQLNARATATFTTAVAGNTLTIGATTFTGTAGAVTPGAATFSIDTSDTATAASFKAQVEAHAVAGLLVGVTVAAGVAKIRALSAGTAGNAIAISKVGSPIALTATGGGALAGAFLEGGLAQSAAGWDYGDTDTQGAAALAAVVNASANAAISGIITATSAVGVVTFKAVTEGTAGNALTVTKTGAPITLTAQGGGADTGVFQNGAAYSGDQYDGIYNGGSVSAVAASLAAAIVRSATALVVDVVTATSALGVTTITALGPGIEGNAITLSASGTGPTASGARLTGGSATSITTEW